MYLFKSREPRDSKHLIALLGGSTISLTDCTRFLFENLTAEEKPSHMLLELSLLVVLLHVWAYVYLQRPAENVTPPTPLMMQVALIPAPAQKASAPASAPTVKPTVPKKLKQKPTVPKKPKQKPTIAKKPPVARKPPLTRPQKPVSKSMRSEPQASRAAVPASAPSQPAPFAPSAPSTPTAATKSESFTEANYRANYAFNPKPEYPRIARSRGWHGRVLLRVQVSATGTCDKVAVHRSSGHEILDKSAMEAVKKWRFIPARRGNNPVASSVVVPILFSLNN